MKYLKPAAVAAASISMSTTPAVAGNIAEPLMEPEVIVEEATTSSGGFIIPLLFLVLIAAATSDTPRE